MPLNNPSFVAGGTIQPCRFVKSDGTNDYTVVQSAAATDDNLGISQEGSHDTPGLTGSATDAARDGQQLRVYGPGDEALLELGTGGASPGDELVSDGSGKGVKAATSGTALEYVGAVALQTGVAGDKIRVAVVRYPRRIALA